MKRALCLTVLLAALSAGAFAQSNLDSVIQPLNGDITALMTSIGSDIAPQLLQATLAGDIVGEAAFAGDFPHGSITLPAIGADFGNGIATVLNDSSHAWNFVSPMPTLIQNAVGSSDAYKASHQIFPYPNLSFGVGFGIAQGFELLASGIYIPQALTSPLFGSLSSGSTISGVNFSATSIVVKLRKVLFYDRGGFPAMSLALGGAYGKVDLGASVNLDQNIGGTENLNLVGPATFDTQVYGVGLEFAISKRLPVITPFANVGVWYRHAIVTSDINMNATISDTSNSSLTPVSTAITSNPTATDDGVDARLGGGLEIRIFAVILHLSASLDMENPLLNIQSLSLTGIAANDLSLSAGLRFEF